MHCIIFNVLCFGVAMGLMCRYPYWDTFGFLVKVYLKGAKRDGRFLKE
ncbi:hypothetical protein LPH50_05840 [Xylella taiwanensis]|uniref:Uncharacterized protein n=1 Tax=Xylella taiwanensis TaxID=1444770 RepID=A0ABS8TWF5_9GAMM|nr:hypothetical protein [Xylella taiwanensis]MCD8455494.1 hypothetical protein [Xylella taiwanensis]MCD8457900.1 hypothetical protein [Xylella taiwanensis]MCD8460035.1 hypothetical protein [Xylella taiwanensis]MCD8463905.1 hypothetical protein [Xylella taiwanensis]MCD8464541.1 hypothetical protein [Xylella taiwanensis]